MPIDPKTGNLIEGDITKETKPTIKNLKAILFKAGMTFDNVVKTSI